MDYKYTAFISYRHLEPDASIAAKVHTMIETFPIPKEFYVDSKKPTFRVFRDREELTTSSLSDSIDEALKSSKYLVVICSKRLPLSQWCNREVETFIKLHGIDRVIPVLIEGEPHESFPPALLSKEILAAELRSPEVLSPDFVGFEKLEKENPAQLKTLTQKAIELLNKTEKYRIMAAILNIAYGDLVQRDKQRRQRLLTRIFIGATVLLSFFGIFMFNAYRNENIARMEAVQNNSKLLLDRAQAYLDNGDKVLSVLVSNQAMAPLTPSMQRYPQLKSQHTGILNDAINIQQPSIMTVINNDNRYAFSTISEDSSKIYAGFGNGKIGVWDLKYGTLLHTIDAHLEQVKLVTFSPDGSKFASGAFDNHIKIWDAKSYQELAEVDLGGFIMYIDYSRDGQYIYTISFKSPSYVLRKYSTSNYQQVGDELVISSNISRVSPSKVSSLVAMRFNTYNEDQSLVIYDLDTMREVRKINHIRYSDSTNPEAEPTPLPFMEVAHLDGTDYILALNMRGVYLIDGRSGEILASKDLRLSSDSMIRQNKDTQDIFISSFGSVFQLAANTLEHKREINFGSGIIKCFDISVNNDIVAIFQDGNVGLAQNGVVTQRNFDYGAGLPEYVRFSKDGKYVVFDSLTNKQFKVAHMEVAEPGQEILGSIQLVSDNSHYSVFSGEGQYFLWNNQNNQEVARLKLERQLSTDYQAQKQIHLANDGKHLGYYWSAINLETDQRERKVVIVDTATSKIVYEHPLEELPSLMRFHPKPETKQIMLAYSDGKVEFINFETDELIKTMTITQGFLDRIGFSDDLNYIYFDYSDSASTIYDYHTNEKVETIAGSLFFLENRDGKLFAKGIYNNRGFIYQQGSPLQEIRLDDKREYIDPTATYENRDLPINRYHQEKDLLLSITNFGDFKRGYLIDFESGNILKTYHISIVNRNALGFINPQGNRVILDQFSFNVANPNYDFNDPESPFYIESRQASFVHMIEDYDALLELSKPILEHRALTELEKDQLGLR